MAGDQWVGEDEKCTVFIFSICIKGVLGGNGALDLGVLERSFAHCGWRWKGLSLWLRGIMDQIWGKRAQQAKVC